MLCITHTLDPRLATPSLNWVKSEPSEVLAIRSTSKLYTKKLVVDLSSVQACVVTAVGISICGHYSVCVCVCVCVQVGLWTSFWGSAEVVVTGNSRGAGKSSQISATFLCTYMCVCVACA